ncbi:MAG: COX15/CtaA family protein [Pseudomonadota bacterium]
MRRLNLSRFPSYTLTMNKTVTIITDPKIKPVAIWLFVMAVLIAGMVAVGGATRLTDSGLSITEWKPVSGALPPMSDVHWQSEFSKYKSIPEYSEVNAGMSLDAFKVIYWWEWGHRLYGRFLGFAFLIPLIIFAAMGRINRKLGSRLGLFFILGGFQGFLGWWMVSSGLVDRVDVSQYRLAAHLALAIALFAAILWTALDLITERRAIPLPSAPYAITLVIGVYGQIILGAFVAGLRAGTAYNTWPLMNGRFVPEGYFEGVPRFQGLFESMAAVQFNHRIGAYVLLAVAAVTVWKYRTSENGVRYMAVLAAICLQAALGVWTVLTMTPISLGLAHQLGALTTLALALLAAHGSYNTGLHFPSPKVGLMFKTPSSSSIG